MARHDAFTLFEVMLALGILTAAVSVIVNLQMRALERMTRDRDDIEKIFLIKKALYPLFLDPPRRPKKITTKLEIPELTLVTQPGKIHQKSSLAPLHDRLQMIIATGTWRLERTKREATMATFVFKAEPEKEKK